MLPNIFQFRRENTQNGADLAKIDSETRQEDRGNKRHRISINLPDDQILFSDDPEIKGFTGGDYKDMAHLYLVMFFIYSYDLATPTANSS